MADVPQQIRNSQFMEPTQGGLYPGGSGKITDIKYTLWDYDGHMEKDSVFAVQLVMQPSDGSNESKPAIVHWSAGNPKEFQPNHDGSFPIALQPSTAPNLRPNTNWDFVFNKFKNNCGLQDAHIDGATGLRALIGSEITLTRVDQPERVGLADAPPVPGKEAKKKNYKPTILIPARCKYPWDGATTVAAPVTISTAATTAGFMPPAASTNGHVAGSGDIDGTIMACLTEILATETAVAMGSLPIKLMERLNTKGVTAQQRLAYIPKVKDTDYVMNLSLVNGWKFDGATLSL